MRFVNTQEFDWNDLRKWIGTVRLTNGGKVHHCVSANEKNEIFTPKPEITDMTKEECGALLLTLMGTCVPYDPVVLVEVGGSYAHH